MDYANGFMVTKENNDLIEVFFGDKLIHSILVREANVMLKAMGYTTGEFKDFGPEFRKIAERVGKTGIEAFGGMQIVLEKKKV